MCFAWQGNYRMWFCFLCDNLLIFPSCSSINTGSNHHLGETLKGVVFHRTEPSIRDSEEEQRHSCSVVRQVFTKEKVNPTEESYLSSRLLRTFQELLWVSWPNKSILPVHFSASFSVFFKKLLPFFFSSVIYQYSNGPFLKMETAENRKSLQWKPFFLIFFNLGFSWKFFSWKIFSVFWSLKSNENV